MSKNDEQTEKRTATRVFFSLEEGIEATIDSHGSTPNSIPVTVLSISSGGLSFMVNRYRLPEIKEGDPLILKDVLIPAPLGPIDRLEGEVRYILDFEHNLHLSLGCVFTGLPGELVSRLEEYVHYRLKNHEEE